MYYLLTGERCPKCEQVKKFLERNPEIKDKLGEEFKEINTSSKEGFEYAVKWKARSVPMLVITPDGEEAKEMVSGEGNIINYFEAKV